LIGFLVSRSVKVTRLLEPIFSGTFAIPLTLFFPLFIFFFGIGPASKVAYGALYSFFPIVLTSIAAFSNVDRLHIASARSMGASSFQMFRYVYLPSALPVIVTGLRIGFFICIASVLGGETLSSAAGVGKAIALSAELMETARMYSWMVFVVLTSFMLNMLVSAAEARRMHG
jgi:ABC-type nitrate/sulfonate/bicarbonate transport system permease component